MQGMAEVHYLDESHLLIFLLQVLVLLACARGLGELFRRWKQPAITAEIIIGVVFGPTILKRILPGVYGFLFPMDVIQVNMLETVAWVGLLLFLLKTGLEIDFSSAWRQKGDALKISLSDLTVPMLITFIPCVFLPDHYMGPLGQKLIFAFFIATVMTLSALPVTARVLGDLNLYKTELGFLIMSALSVNDLLGWVIFTLLLGFFTDANVVPMDIVVIIGATIGFTVLCLTVGRKFTNAVISRFREKQFPEPGTSLTFICLLGILCGAITLKIGIHALFGFFIAGIMAGEAKALPEKTRQVISNMVHAIFIPLFFVSVGLKVDFLKNFDLFLVAFLLILGIFARLAGAWIGVKLTGKYKASRMLIALAHIPGGEMQIVVGLLALEYRLITETVFVAIVTGAVLSSMILGPLMSFALRRRKHVNLMEFFARRTLIPDIKASEKETVIEKMCEAVSEQENMPDKDIICSIVMGREREMGTAIECGVAIPHGRVSGLDRPVVSFARNKNGVDWDSPDGELTKFIFLILCPEQDRGFQLQILRAISISMSKKEVRDALSAAEDDHAIWEALRETFSEHIVTGGA